MEQILIDGAVPVDRDAEDALRFLALPGIGIRIARHPEDRVSFLPVTRHRATSLLPGLAWPSLRYTPHSMTRLVSGCNDGRPAGRSLDFVSRT
jgi:hypothetical protein